MTCKVSTPSRIGPNAKQCTLVLTAPARTNGQTCAFYAFMGCGQQFGWSGTWKEYEWEVGDKEIYPSKGVWGKALLTDLSGQKWEVFVCTM